MASLRKTPVTAQALCKFVSQKSPLNWLRSVKQPSTQAFRSAKIAFSSPVRPKALGSFREIRRPNGYCSLPVWNTLSTFVPRADEKHRAGCGLLWWELVRNSEWCAVHGAALAVLMAGTLAWAQGTIQPHDRLKDAIAESGIVSLAGSVHPAVAHAVSSAAVEAGFSMEHMILSLQPDAAQQAALDELVAQQQDPQSDQYRKFLTPGEYAARFGASQNDINKIAEWLSRHGLTVEEVTANRLSIVFSGSARAVQSAFKTEVKQYSVNGKVHHANASDPQIPAALAGIVKGVVKMHDFRARPFSRGLRLLGQPVQPSSNASPAAHYLGPADFSVIYNISRLYVSGLNGSGQSIAVVGRSNIQLTDIASFRSHFGLPSNTPSVIVAQDADPGFTADGDAVEATLDVEWAGAIAPRAAVKLVVAASTSSSDGVDLAAQYAVNHNVAPVLSVSFGSCEADMGGAELAFYNSLWQQAAAQGISVFVSAGDSGAAGCDSAGAASGTTRAVNGICSSPFATCVGGTQFNEGANPGSYWLPGNNPVLGTAQSYIPEQVWNESAANGGSELLAGGGGASSQWPKPRWQIGGGVPADGRRDVPDIAVTAAAHDGYLIFFNGALSVVSGTSAASPSLASLFTIVNQKYNSAQGNINPVLYPLAVKQAQGGAAVFHDIVSGNNTVPGVAGYAAGIGYDLASGLGSIDGQQLVNHWRDASLNGGLTIALPSAITVQAGQNATVPAIVSVNGGFNWPVTFSVSGVPAGVNATFGLPVLPAPGSGTTSLQFAANLFAAGGTYNLTVTAAGTGSSVSATATIALTVNAITPNCSLMTDPANVRLAIGQATNLRVTCPSPQGRVPASLNLAVSGQPAGVTASFSQPALTPGTGLSTLTIIATNSAAAGNYTLAITASNGAFSKTISVPLTLAMPPGFALTTTNTALSINQGASMQLSVAVTHTGSFNSAVTLLLSGLPLGITGTFAPAQFAAPGDGASLLTLQIAGYAPPGKYTISVVGVGGVLRNTLPLTVTVNAAPTFDFAADLAAPTIYAGQAPGQVNLTVKNLTGNFNSAVTFSVAGLPSGVTATFAPAALAAPGSGTSILSLTAAGSATPGQYRFAVSATGGGVVRYANLLLTVIGPPSFALKTDVTSLALVAGATFNTAVGIVPQNGFNSPITWTVGTLPVGITVSFSSNTIGNANNGVTMMVQTASSLPAANYSIAISGTSGAASSTVAIALSIGSIQVGVGSPALTVARGGRVSTPITVTATNFAGNVLFSMTGLPGGVDYTLAPMTMIGPGTNTLTIAPQASVTPGIYTVTLRTAAGGSVLFNPLQITVN
jgi:uncharacterized membrane protein